MKTKILFFAFVLVALAACNTESEVNYSPDILFNKLPVNISKSDTLNIRGTSDNNILLLDTISVGDTVSFKMLFTGHVNSLVSLSISQSADSISRIILPSKLGMDSIFTAESNYSTGDFIVKPKIVSIYLPFKYIALKSSKEGSLKFSITSDANFKQNSGLNTIRFELKTPIKQTVAVQ